MSTFIPWLQEIEQRGVHLILIDRGGLRVRGPRAVLSEGLLARLREHKLEVIAALKDRVEAARDHASVPTYSYGITRPAPDIECDLRSRYVTCGSCANWTGGSPCGAGMVTSGDPIPGAGVRLCGFHTPKRKQ